MQLQLLGLVARELGVDGAVADEVELDTDLEAEVHDARDLGLDADAVGIGPQDEIVGRTSPSPNRATGPRKPMTNSLAGVP